MMKYVISTKDPHKIKRAICAEDLAMVVWDFDQMLRGWEKYGDDVPFMDAAEKIREEFHETLAHHGIILDGLFE